MDLMEFKNKLDTSIQFVSETKTEMIYKCPFCKDHGLEDKSGHLYISKDKPIFFCFKCNTKGHLSKLFKYLSLGVDVTFDPSYQRVNQYSTVSNSYEIDDYAEDYLAERLGRVCIDPEEARVISSNELKRMYLQSPEYNKHRFIPYKGIAFLGYFKKKIVFRHSDPKMIESGRRYDVFKLSEGPDVYVLGNKRRMSEWRKHKTIVVGEGIFDILNTYYNLDLFPKDSIYVAALNSNIKLAVNVARSVSSCFYPNIKILADVDKTDDHYLSSISFAFHDRCTVYRNESGKDFGEKVVTVKKGSF